MSDFIYLASQSPRRSQLLDQLGVAHRVLLPEPHEDAEALEQVLPGEAARAYVQRVTGLKLAAALGRMQRLGVPTAPVLCADTTVALGRSILGKPADAADARRMLRALSGRTHRVLTAVALGWDDRSVQALCVSRVRFASLGEAAIDAYVDSGEPLGKAGAYAVQGRAAGFIAHISGSYSGIMGLGLFETAQALQSMGLMRCNKTF
ncbi:MAG: Maf family protein [Rhodoferax sp.]